MKMKATKKLVNKLYTMHNNYSKKEYELISACVDAKAEDITDGEYQTLRKLIVNIDKAYIDLLAEAKRLNEKYNGKEIEE